MLTTKCALLRLIINVSIVLRHSCHPEEALQNTIALLSTDALLLTGMRVTLVYLNLSPLASIYQSVSPRTTCIVAWRWNRLTKRRNAAWPTVHEDHITCHQVLSFSILLIYATFLFDDA